MAQELTQYDFTGSRGRPPLHDWDKLLNGSPWRLARGSDFRGRPDSFRRYAYAKAAQRGLKVHTHVEDGKHVVLRAYVPLAVAA